MNSKYFPAGKFGILTAGVFFLLLSACSSKKERRTFYRNIQSIQGTFLRGDDSYYYYSIKPDLSYLLRDKKTQTLINRYNSLITQESRVYLEKKDILGIKDDPHLESLAKRELREKLNRMLIEYGAPKNPIKEIVFSELTVEKLIR